jgi:uncharacterized repeat protein (TIGR01451 family)
MAEQQERSRKRIICQSQTKGVIRTNGNGRRNLFIMSIFWVGVFFLHTNVSPAQTGPLLDLKTTAEKEVRVQKNGKWVVERVPLDKTGPRDILVYTISYRNTGKSPIVDATIVDPIPAGTLYVLDSAEGKDAEIACSIDGGRSYQKPPASLRVKKPDGTEEVKPAPADRYTHIQWVIKKPVPPGESGRVSLKVTVR